nr:hypothetical protein [Desulfobacterales bacterium]
MDGHGDTSGETGIGVTWLTIVGVLGSMVIGADEIQAYGLATGLECTFDFPWPPHLMAKFVNGSGDSDPPDGVFRRTDTVLYGWTNLFFRSNMREYRLDLGFIS